MKKILFALFGFAILSASTLQAQVDTKKVAKTISAADTITFSSIGSNLMAIEYNYTEASGATAGKVYLEGSVFGLKWQAIDSISLTDVTTVQTLYKAITSTAFASYRFRNTNTSSATGAVVAGPLRRPDEHR